MDDDDISRHKQKKAQAWPDARARSRTVELVLDEAMIASLLRPLPPLDLSSMPPAQLLAVRDALRLPSTKQ